MNLVQVKLELYPAIKSMNVLVRKACKQQLVKWLFLQLSSVAEFDLNRPIVQKVIILGASNYSKDRFLTGILQTENRKILSANRIILIFDDLQFSNIRKVFWVINFNKINSRQERTYIN